MILWPAIRTLPREFLESALVDGYGPIGVTRRIAVPLTVGPIATAWGVAFVLAFGELPASHLVLPPGHMTLSTRVWMLLHTGVESHLAGVGLILLALYGLVGLGTWTILVLHRRAGSRIKPGNGPDSASEARTIAEALSTTSEPIG